MKYAFVIVVTIILSGCATDPMVTQQIVEANQKLLSTATLKVTCPPSGCQFSSLEYTDPRDKAQLKMPTNGYDAVISLGQGIKDVATSAIPVLGMYKLGTAIATKGFEAKTGDVINTNTTNTATTTTTTNTSTAMTGSTGVMGGGSFSAPVNTMSNSTGVLGSGTYSTTSTNTLGSGVMGSGTYSTVDRHDSYTATPTVVTVPTQVITTAK